MQAVNSVLDKVILRPVAKAYAKVVPQPIRKGVTNFFTNLQQPITTVNLVLQGKPKPAAQTSPFERGPGMGGSKRAVKKKGQ